jgi:hypothetical protein
MIRNKEITTTFYCNLPDPSGRPSKNEKKK